MDWEHAQRVAFRRLARRPALPPRLCRASDDSVFLYRDAGHLSFEGSRWVGERAPALRLPAAP
jgi:hypothetical protein